MQNDLETIYLDRVRVNKQRELLKQRMERANKAQNIEYRHMLEFFKTELNLWLDAVEIKDYSLTLDQDESEEYLT